MLPTNAADKWRRQMLPINGADKWRRQTPPINAAKRSCRQIPPTNGVNNCQRQMPPTDSADSFHQPMLSINANARFSQPILPNHLGPPPLRGECGVLTRNNCCPSPPHLVNKEWSTSSSLQTSPVPSVIISLFPPGVEAGFFVRSPKV